MSASAILFVLRIIALLLSFSLFAAPLAQSNVLVNWAEECGSKPPPVVEEESHKSIAPAVSKIPDRGRGSKEQFGYHGHSYFLAPVREVLTPPPDRC